MSDTPRTDVEEVRFNLSGAYRVDSHFARQLEQELNGVKASLKEAIEGWSTQTEMYEKAIAEIESLKAQRNRAASNFR